MFMDNFSASFFINNRSKLFELLLPSSAVIISSNRSMPRNGDQFFPFRQSSDLYYLTGILNESVTLVIYPGTSSDSFNELLYIPKTDNVQEKWSGAAISISEASQRSGIKEVRYMGDIIIELREILSRCSYVYFGMPASGSHPFFRSNEYEIRQSLANQLSNIQEHQLAPLLTRLRMFKEAEEIAAIRQAMQITSDVFSEVVTAIQPGMMEYEVESMLTGGIRKRGSRGHAFDPIVASGANALVLHYIRNDHQLNPGELLLLDYGAEWQYYASDISRTLPINGKFTKRQRELYEATLRILNQAMKLMTPGLKLSEYNQQVGRLWEEEHLRLGLYTRRDIKQHSKEIPIWKKYFWHGTSHSIGIDVHDPVDHSLALAKGMVLSCEPGIYIPEEGIGIRLENDMLVTHDKPENLSANIPVEPEEIEALMKH